MKNKKKQSDKKDQGFQLTWLPKKAFEILAIIPWSEIKEARDKALAKAGENLEIKGFRKGKAPQKFVIETLGSQKVLELTLQGVIPDYYQKAIGSLGLRPIIAPKINLVSAKEAEDWQIKFTACEVPEISLGNYKEELKKQKASLGIWTPGKDQKEKPKEDKDEKINKTIKWLLENVKVEICDLLVEEEVTRRLTGLLEQTQKLAITVDQYLASTGKTVDQLKDEYGRQAKEGLSLEFVLEKIADEERVEVKPEEIEKLITGAKTDEEKKALESQKYYLATLVRRQKTLDFLASLL